MTHYLTLVNALFGDGKSFEHVKTVAETVPEWGQALPLSKRIAGFLLMSMDLARLFKRSGAEISPALGAHYIQHALAAADKITSLCRDIEHSLLVFRLAQSCGAVFDADKMNDELEARIVQQFIACQWHVVSDGRQEYQPSPPETLQMALNTGVFAKIVLGDCVDHAEATTQRVVSCAQQANSARPSAGAQ